MRRKSLLPLSDETFECQVLHSRYYAARVSVLPKVSQQWCSHGFFGDGQAMALHRGG